MALFAALYVLVVSSFRGEAGIDDGKSDVDGTFDAIRPTAIAVIVTVVQLRADHGHLSEYLCGDD